MVLLSGTRALPGHNLHVHNPKPMQERGPVPTRAAGADLPLRGQRMGARGHQLQLLAGPRPHVRHKPELPPAAIRVHAITSPPQHLLRTILPLHPPQAQPLSIRMAGGCAPQAVKNRDRKVCGRPAHPDAQGRTDPQGGPKVGGAHGQAASGRGAGQLYDGGGH
jgi:hypothetical protein